MEDREAQVELLPRPAAQVGDEHVPVGGKPETREKVTLAVLPAVVSPSLSQAVGRGEIGEVLVHGQGFENEHVLGAIADLSRTETSPDEGESRRRSS